MKSAYNSLNINSKNAKVLIVEDNDDQWMIIRQAMQQSFGEVTAQRVSSTEQALTLLQDWERQEWEIPKLILLDLYMPDNTDSWQFMKQIKAMSPMMRRIPIVMLTSSAIVTDIEQAYQLGVSAYMVKPIEYTEWLVCFRQLRTYWLETVTLPPIQYGF